MEHQNEHRMEVPSRKGVSRIEVLDGPTGRHRWPDGVKARILAESLAPGARGCDVAHKYGLIARHVLQWRGFARQGKLILRDHSAAAFVPLVVEQAATPDPVAAKTDVGVIKIEIAGAVLHVAPDCSPDRAAALAAALKRAL